MGEVSVVVRSSLSLLCLGACLNGTSTPSQARVSVTAASLSRPAILDTSVPVTAFVNVAVIPMDGERVLTGQTVLVRGGYITALGPSNRVRIPPGAVRIDGRRKFLIPGLADMHTHLQFQDSAKDERLLLQMVAHGTTTIRNMDFIDHIAGRNFHLTGGWLLRLRARATSRAIVSPRIYTSGVWAGTTAGRPTDAAIAIPAYKEAGYDFIKIHDEDPETFDSVTAVAHRVGMPIVGHLVPGISLERDLAAYRSIEHLQGSHTKTVKDALEALKQEQIDAVTFLDTVVTIPGVLEFAAATQRAGVWSCPTQALSEWLVNRESSTTMSRAIGGALSELHLRRRIIKALQETGALLLAGTDEMAGNDLVPFDDWPPQLWIQDELVALVRAGLTPYQALVTGTRNVAVYFGTLGEEGTVTVGKRADLVLLDGNPLVDIQYARQITGVMLSGRWFSSQELDQRLIDAKSPAHD